MSPADVDVTSKADGMLNSPVACLNKDWRIADAWSEAEPSWSARMIRTIDGGMICPKVPEAQIVPEASDGE